MTLYEHIGCRLREERKKRGIKLKEVAERLNRSKFYVMDAERGRFRMTLDKLYEYCAVLDIPLKTIIPDYIPGSSTESYNKLKGL